MGTNKQKKKKQSNKKAIKKPSKPVDLVKTFKPTPHMKVFLDTAIELQTDNITKIARVAEIDQSNYYIWRKQEGFNQWYQEEFNKRLKLHAWKLDLIGMKNASKQYKYWEGMQKRVGNLSDNGNGTQVNVQVNNDLKDLRDEDIDAKLKQLQDKIKGF